MPRAEKAPRDRIIGIVVRKNGKLQFDPSHTKTSHNLIDLALASQKIVREGDVVVGKKTPDGDIAISRVLGQKNDPGVLSLVSLYEQGLSHIFSDAAKKEASAMTIPSLENREDLRRTPLVTIDGADARDFDDAVFAEKTSDGGHHLIVAIADVSWYVRPGSALDQDAQTRGNSTYFPDMVAPMLPEELSNGLCSLKPNEDRACMAFHLWIDKDGNLTNSKVVRGLMRSAARLTYKQVQIAKDGKPDNLIAPLMDNVIDPLYDAYAVLRQAREKRGAMDLDLSDEGRLDSHRLIEEFMILANVAAAQALESKAAPCVYRIHDKPRERSGDALLDALRSLLAPHGIAMPQAVTHASAYKEVLEKTKNLPEAATIAKTIARLQAKAEYNTDNIGHFGLALQSYAHFTSPIRRYADLLVHRSLVDAFNMGAGGLGQEQKARMQEIAKHISETENLSAKAERAARDRLAVASLAKRIGETFTGRVTGETVGGLFVKLDKARAGDAFLPKQSLPQGRYRRGDNISVVLKEADALKNNIVVAPANDNRAPARKKPSLKGPRRRPS